MNAYLVNIHYNKPLKVVEPKQIWLKAESFEEIETKLKQKLGSELRRVELLQTIKKI